VIPVPQLSRRLASIGLRVLVAAAMFTTVIIVGSMMMYAIIHCYAKLKGVDF
jgi:hypothetical protein